MIDKSAHTHTNRHQISGIEYEKFFGNFISRLLERIEHKCNHITNVLHYNDVENSLCTHATCIISYMIVNGSETHSPNERVPVLWARETKSNATVATATETQQIIKFEQSAKKKRLHVQYTQAEAQAHGLNTSNRYSKKKRQNGRKIKGACGIMYRVRTGYLILYRVYRVCLSNPILCGKIMCGERNSCGDFTPYATDPSWCCTTVTVLHIHTYMHGAYHKRCCCYCCH